MARLRGVAYHVRDREALLPDLERARAHAAHVEEIVEEAPHVPHLALDHLLAIRELVGQERDRVPDRRERIPELVGERREELVLPAVGLAHRLLAPLERCFHAHALHDLAIGAGVEVGVVERHRHRSDEAAQNVEVLARVGVGLVAHHLHDTDHGALELDRDHHGALRTGRSRAGAVEIAHAAAASHVVVAPPGFFTRFSTS
jgi:hypothetical protein